jgi:hypothetical protein
MIYSIKAVSSIVVISARRVFLFLLGENSGRKEGGKVLSQTQQCNASSIEHHQSKTLFFSSSKAKAFPANVTSFHK